VNIIEDVTEAKAAEHRQRSLAEAEALLSSTRDHHSGPARTHDEMTQSGMQPADLAANVGREDLPTSGAGRRDREGRRAAEHN
jgi:hypothetical protein